MREYIAEKYRGQKATLSLDTDALKAFDDVIDLSIGDTDFVTDTRIIHAAMEDAERGYTRYGDPQGDPELISAIQKAWFEDFHQNLNRDDILVTASSCMGMQLALMATLNPGDEVLVLGPYFGVYAQQIAVAGGVCVEVPTDAKHGFCIVEDSIERAVTDRTRGIIVNTPCNPTGSALSLDDMKKLADAGCWSRSALTNTISDDDAFAALQGAAIAWNASVFTYMKSAEKNEGVTCMAYDLTKDTFVSAEAYSNNDMAIAAASRNPERAAMVLDLIKYDTYLNRLLLLGVEGVHYSINNATGEYTKLEKNGDYPPLSVSVSWAVKNGNLTESGTPERELVMTDSWAERVKSNPTVTFVFDDSEISEYVSAVNSVLGEYIGMLQLGLVDDVDKTIDEMLSRIYDAGMQEVYDEFYRQYEAWYQTR